MDTAARIFAQTLFPDALSKTSPDLSELQKAMLDATPDCIKVVSIDGKLLMMNRAGCAALNVPEDSDFGMPWIPLLPVEVHALGADALQKASKGQSTRFPGKSISSAGTKYWDNLLMPLVDGSGRTLSILCVSRDVTAQTQLEIELQESIGRERLLSGEMRHRIKNLFSLVSGLILIAEKEAAQNQVSATGVLREKLGALSRASDALFSPSPTNSTDEIDLQTCIMSVLKPYGDRCSLAGDKAAIRRNMMTTLALFVHELATNSIKYGALCKEGGKISISWVQTDESLNITWIEEGGPPISAVPNCEGFGTEMIDRILRFAGGKIIKTWKAEGLTAILELPRPA